VAADHEGADHNGLIVLGPEVVQFVGIDDDVFVFGVLEAGDDLFVPYLAMDRTGLLVLDATVALGVKLVEVNFTGAADRGLVGSDGNGD